MCPHPLRFLRHSIEKGCFVDQSGSCKTLRKWRVGDYSIAHWDTLRKEKW